MARTVDQAARQTKRDAILDQAALLIQSVGYDQMSVQELISRLGISRGALYHYFDSKQAILEALIDRMGSQALATLLPIIEDPDLTALQKFHRYVSASISFKSGQQELIKDLVQVWYSEDNLRVRHKLQAATLDSTAPQILEPIIRQGVAEQTFDTRYPTEVARIIAGIWLGLADSLIMLADGDGPVIDRARILIDATTDSIERILGAPPGSLGIGRVEDLFAITHIPSSPTTEKK